MKDSWFQFVSMLWNADSFLFSISLAKTPVNQQHLFYPNSWRIMYAQDVICRECLNLTFEDRRWKVFGKAHIDQQGSLLSFSSDGMRTGYHPAGPVAVVDVWPLTCRLFLWLRPSSSRLSLEALVDGNIEKALFMLSAPWHSLHWMQ